MKIVTNYKKKRTPSRLYLSGVIVSESKFGKNEVVLTWKRSEAKCFADDKEVKTWFKDNGLVFSKANSVEEK